MSSNNKATPTKERVSALEQALTERERKTYCFPVHFLVFPGKPMLGVGIRVATRTEDDEAIIEAHKHAVKKAGDPNSAAVTDPDLITDAKTVEALYRICREVDPESIKANPDQPDKWATTQYAAFRGPSILRDKLTTDEIAFLLALYLEVKRKEAPGATEISDETVEALAESCALNADNDVPEAVLAKYPRTFLTHSLVVLSVKLVTAREACEELLKDIEARDSTKSEELARLRSIEQAAQAAVAKGANEEALAVLKAALHKPVDEDGPAG
jgi:hypothetical protein